MKDRQRLGMGENEKFAYVGNDREWRQICGSFGARQQVFYVLDEACLSAEFDRRTRRASNDRN